MNKGSLKSLQIFLIFHFKSIGSSWHCVHPNNYRGYTQNIVRFDALKLKFKENKFNHLLGFIWTPFSADSPPNNYCWPQHTELATGLSAIGFWLLSLSLCDQHGLATACPLQVGSGDRVKIKGWHQICNLDSGIYFILDWILWYSIPDIQTKRHSLISGVLPTIEYPNVFICLIMNRANIQIYSHV